jgi:ketosteroid isomerase-like protein
LGEPDLTGTRQTLFMILAMTFLMGIILSGIFTWQAIGLGAGFFAEWAGRFVSTYVIVLPTVLLVSPVAQRFARWLNGVLGPPRQPSPHDVALDAWRANAAGHSGADFGPWLASLAKDVSIWMPLGAFRGENSGQDRAAEIYGAIAAASPRLTYEAPFRVSTTGQTVVLEFEDHGTIAGMPYRNRIAASFDIKYGKVAAYREYFGDIDPAIVAMMTAQSNAGQP